MKRNYYLLFLALTLIITLSGCEDITGEKKFGGSGAQHGYSAEQTNDGGCIIAGSTEDNFYILKVNEIGEVEWERTEGGDGNDWAHGVLQTSDGGFLVAGDTESYGPGDPENYGSYGNIWVIKYDANGNKLWERVYGHELHEGVRSMKATSDGGFILAGYSHSFGNGDIFVIKLDESGNMEWEQNYGDDKTQVGHSIVQAEDGGYFVAGTSMDENGRQQGIIIKTDASGNEEWTRIYGDSSRFNVIQSIDIVNDGIIAAGYTTTDIFPNNDSDAWVLKLDSSGNLEWENNFGGSRLDTASSIVYTDNGYTFTGATRSFGNGNNYESDLWIVRIDSAGNMVWNKTFGSSDNDAGHALDIADDGGYIIVGDTMNGAINFYDIYLLKIDANGNM